MKQHFIVGQLRITRKDVQTAFTMRLKRIVLDVVRCPFGCTRDTAARYKGQKTCAMCEKELLFEQRVMYKLYASFDKAFNGLALVNDKLLCNITEQQSILLRFSMRSAGGTWMNGKFVQQQRGEVYKMFSSYDDAARSIASIRIKSEEKEVQWTLHRIPTEQELFVQWELYEKAKFIQRL
jgi:hypothetical protein